MMGCLRKGGMYWLFFILVVPIIGQQSTLGSLDLEELRDVQYSIQILETPVADSSPVDGSVSTLVMVNREGQRYRCKVPRPVEETSDDEEGSASENSSDVEALLAPLETAPCIFKTKDWWTYEICYRRDIKQYHVENDRPVGAVMVLGVHSPGEDNWEPTNRTYQPQYYRNGSNCDLTSRPRQTELRFVCNEAATVEFIGDIFEPQSCEYTIVVHTARLCSVKWLRPEAESTPLPIHCNPLLSTHQFKKYQLYQEKKAMAVKLAEKERRAKQATLLAAQKSSVHGEGTKPLLKEGGMALGGLLDLMGDNMADRLVGEINNLLDNALVGEKDRGVKVLDLRDKELESSEPPVSRAIEVEQFRAAEATPKVDKWDLIHSVHKPLEDPELQELVNTRNSLWRKIHEAKKTVKKYTGQLHDTDTFINNENVDTFKSKEILDKLEQQKKFIEKALVKAREEVAIHEDLAKDVSHKIVAQQNKLKLAEEVTWKKKLELLMEKMQQGPEQFEGPGSPTRFSNIIKEMVVDYEKATNEKLTRIDDYFKYAKKFVNNEELGNFEELRKFMQFANKDLSLMAIDQIKYNNENNNDEDIKDKYIKEDDLKEFDKEIEMLSEEKKAKVSKFRDVVKDDVRQKFGDILQEISEELKLPEGDVDQDEAMKAMSATLDQLVSKLAGSSEKMKEVQKHVSDLKKVTEEVTEKSLNLKRDGKRSVKKELRDEDEPGVKPQRGDIPVEETDAELDDDDDNSDEDEPDEFDVALAEARRKLEEAEAEVEQLEKEWKEEKPPKIYPKSSGGENLKVSVTKMGPGVGEALDEQQAVKIAKRLEGTIKDKLAKLGIDTGNRPIEVKLITTQLPEGLGLGEEGDPQNDQQVQSMFFNMMTGNVQGYEDIDSQRKAESSYKFKWDDKMIEDIDQKLEDYRSELGEVANEADDGDNDVVHDAESKDTEVEVVESKVVNDVEGGEYEVLEDTGHQPEEIVLSDDQAPDFDFAGEQRQRPSSMESQIQSDSTEEIIERDEESEEGADDLIFGEGEAQPKDEL